MSFARVACPKLRYNFTNNGEPVAYTKGSELDRIAEQLKSKSANVDWQRLVAERDILLHAVVTASGKLHFRRNSSRDH
jgi:hypothetical protein